MVFKLCEEGIQTLSSWVLYTFNSFFLQVKAFSNTSFVTSSVDSGLSLWKDDGLRLKTLKGGNESITRHQPEF